MGVTSVRLNSDIVAPLENLAKQLDRSKNYLINQPIKEFVARQAMEDSCWDDTLKALEAMKEGKLIDGSGVISWLKTWGTDSESSPPSV